MPKINESDVEIKNKGVVQLTTEQWTEIMNRLDRAEQGSKGLQKPVRVTEHTAMVRFFNDKPVIKTSNYRERQVEGKWIAFFDLYLLGEDKPTNVEYIKFLNVELEGAGTEKVKIIKQTATSHVKNYGQMTAVNPDPFNNKKFVGDMIDLDATSTTYVAEVEVCDDQLHAGLKFEIDTKSLNN